MRTGEVTTNYRMGADLIAQKLAVWPRAVLFFPRAKPIKNPLSVSDSLHYPVERLVSRSGSLGHWDHAQEFSTLGGTEPGPQRNRPAFLAAEVYGGFGGPQKTSSKFKRLWAWLKEY